MSDKPKDDEAAPSTLFGLPVVRDSTVPSPSELLRGVLIGPAEMVGVDPAEWPEGAAAPILADEATLPEGDR